MCLGSSGGHNDINTFLLGEDGIPCQPMIQMVTFVQTKIMTWMLLVMLNLVMQKLMMILTIDGQVVFIFFT